MSFLRFIYVQENQTVQKVERELKGIFVKNYEEAAGTIAAIRAGISKESLHRPFEQVKIHRVE